MHLYLKNYEIEKILLDIDFFVIYNNIELQGEYNG